MVEEWEEWEEWKEWEEMAGNKASVCSGTKRDTTTCAVTFLHLRFLREFEKHFSLSSCV